MTVTNWSRRYGTDELDRICARPGCGETASATLRFQPTRREAWIVDIGEDTPRTRGDLCDRHAVTLELPRGWQLHDQRLALAEVTLVVVREPEVIDEPEAVVIELTADTAAQDDDELVEEVAEQLAEVLDARTPLLKRAFGNVILPD